ncbi:hypothetical protein D1164_16865 [Mariniphaga sediminis]|uniref:Glycoside hydrolase family 127 protein n=1 Tax=Mariniphaga sediminis TaxID=1628158 RepID=A0A399CXW5_9BACT|nr:beta-L-arabinofuranosidase domain-containing protein [Mariniphaga sediminis]RIH64003.1 hypothetical protein D1164_16865 [Mariniphaga sediminis]
MKERRVKAMSLLLNNLFIVLLIITVVSCTEEKPQPEKTGIQPIGYGNVEAGGVLWSRAAASMSRLEKGRYLPDTLYRIPYQSYHYDEWPGDMPGRTLLALTLLERATGREARYLDELIADFPNHLNDKGYMGKDYGELISEQQLAGNSWMFRGLCEQYLWKKDPVILSLLKGFVEGLALPTLGAHKNYPIDPGPREHAEEMLGQSTKMLDGWVLSSDVGCDFVFMDGVVQAYRILKTPELKELSYELANRFFEVDLYGIKAQTHASLTAIRGIIRLYELTGDTRLLEKAIERFHLYKAKGMTENYENFNWFQRTDTWTEPCAVVDSYLAALSLWQHTGNTQYLSDAQLIWYNGICVGQRANGGFGLSTCLNGDHVNLEAFMYEAHWCCTMRGAEAFATKIKSLYFTQNDTIYIPDLADSQAKFELPGGELKLSQKTDYPFGDNVTFTVTESSPDLIAVMKVFIPEWVSDVKLEKSGKVMDYQLKENWLTYSETFDKGDTFTLCYKQTPTAIAANNPDYLKIRKGPLLLGVYNPKNEIELRGNPEIKELAEGKIIIDGTNAELKPIYHVMDEKMGLPGQYKIQTLFHKTE